VLKGFIIKRARVEIISRAEYDGADIRLPDTRELFKSIDEVLDYIDSSEELYATGWGIPTRLYDYHIEEKVNHVVLRTSSTDADVTVSFQMVMPSCTITLDELNNIQYLFK